MASLPNFSTMAQMSLGRIDSTPMESTSGPSQIQAQVHRHDHDQSSSSTFSQVPAFDASLPFADPNAYAYPHPGYSIPFYANASPSQSQQQQDDTTSQAPSFPYGYSVPGPYFNSIPAQGNCISPRDLLQTNVIDTGSHPAYSLDNRHTGLPTLLPTDLPFSARAPNVNTSIPSVWTTPVSQVGARGGVTFSPATPVDSESAPDTNLASPDTEEDEEEERDDVNIEEEEEENPPKTGKGKIKPNKAASGVGAGATSGKEGDVAKKRSRTAQACEKCRVRKARCFGGNPCNRCTKRGFTCEFTPSRLRPIISKPEPKPKVRRHSVHATSHLAPSVNGVISSPIVNSPLGRAQSNNHVLGQARPSPYARPTFTHAHSHSHSHSHPASLGMTPMTLAPSTMMTPAFPHASTQPLTAMPLPYVAGSPYGYTANFQIPAYDQLHQSGMPQTPTIPENGTFPSSLGLSLGSAMASTSFGLGLGLGPSFTSAVLPDESTTSSPSTRSDGLQMSSLSSRTTSTSNTNTTTTDSFPMTSTSSQGWNPLDTSMPMTEEDIFYLSPVGEHDSIQVVGWDEEPVMKAGAGEGSLAMTSTIGQGFSMPQAYVTGTEWYGATGPQ